MKFATMSANGEPVAVSGVTKRINFGLGDTVNQRGRAKKALPNVACQAAEMSPLMPAGPALEDRRPSKLSMPTGESDTRRSTGWVELKYSVNTLGAVCDVHVVASEPAGAFERSSMEAILAWKYKPVLNAEGQPMASTGLHYRMEFKPN